MQRRIDLALCIEWELGARWDKLVTARRIATTPGEQDRYAAEQSAIRQEVEYRLAGDEETRGKGIYELAKKVGLEVLGGEITSTG